LGTGSYHSIPVFNLCKSAGNFPITVPTDSHGQTEFDAYETGALRLPIPYREGAEGNFYTKIAKGNAGRFLAVARVLSELRFVGL
jgi:hypothetical protein